MTVPSRTRFYLSTECTSTFALLAGQISPFYMYSLIFEIFSGRKGIDTKTA